MSFSEGRYYRFQYQGGTREGFRTVFVTEVGDNYILGKDITQDAFRRFHIGKITHCQPLPMKTFSSWSGLQEILRDPADFDELVQAAMPVLARKYKHIEPFNGSYRILPHIPEVKLVRRQLQIGGRTITFNSDGRPVTSDGRILESLDEFAAELARAKT